MKSLSKYLAIVAICSITMVVQPATCSAQAGNRLQQAFKRVDGDRDGKLSKDEVNRFARLKSRLEGADKNGDGFVNETEFREKMMSAAGMQQLKPTTGKLSAGDALRVIDVDGVERRYRVHVPKSYDASKRTPLVVGFHGGGGNPESMIRLSGLNEKSEEAGFIVAYPYGSGTQPDRGLTFNGGGCCGYAHKQKVNDIEFVAGMLDDLATAVNLDTNRVYATGISNGGIMTYFVASELSDRFAAVAPVAGPMMTDSSNAKRPVPIMHFHGTGDKLAPFGGGKGEGSPGVPAFMRPKFNSVEHSINNWIAVNGCESEPKVEAMPDNADDGMKVTRKTWSGGKNGAEVVLFEIENGGHTWPGKNPISEILGKSTMDISANDLMWDFFQKHKLNSGQ